MNDFLQFLVAGVTIGCVYTLVAIGYSVIYNTTKVVNFAQGEFLMIGGMTAIFLLGAGVPFWLSLLLAIVAGVLAGLALEIVGLRFARDASVLMLIVLTIGAAISFRGAAGIVWDRNYHSLQPFSGEGYIEVLGASINTQSIWIICAITLIVTALHYFFTRTMIGKAMRAVASDRDAAKLMGVNVNVVMLTAFALAGALGAVGGILIAPLSLMHFELGVMLGLKGFAAAMLGGLGSFPGAVVGGVLLGLAEAMTAGYVTSAYKDAIAFLIIIVVLFAVPRGLLGEKTVERV